MERSYFCDINERNYWVQNCANYWHHVLDVSAVKGPTMWQRLERKISFLNCLFVCLFFFFFFCYPHVSFFFFFLLFLLSAFFFFPSAFFYPHFPIRIRHPQVSGPRFTDTPACLVFFFLLTFFAIRVFFFSIRIFLSAFSYPHPPSAGIRSAFYRHPSREAVFICDSNLGDW